MKKIIIVIIIIIAAGIIAYAILGTGKKPAYNYVIAKKGELIQEVSVTGKVKPSQSVDLGFEKSGKVAEVLADVNDKIESGQILVRLENADLAAQLLQSQANLETEQAKLTEMQKGARPEEIQKAEVAVSNARKTLVDTEKNLINVKNKAETDLKNLYDDIPNILQDAYAKADDAVNKQIDDLFINDDSANPQMAFIVTDLQIKNDCEWQRVIIGNELKGFKLELTNLTSDYSALDATLNRVENRLETTRNLLTRLIDAVNAGIGLSSTNANTYKTNINTGRTNINTAATNITSQKQTITSQKILNQNNITSAESQVNEAKNSLSSAEANLNLLKAGSTAEQIAAQKANVKAAQANVENYQAQIAKTILRSPIAGIVTKQDAKIGEIVPANTPVVSVMSTRFQVEAYIPEADIAKIKIGNPASITLDAYGEDVIFDAKVIKIDPAGTIIEGVATYKVTMKFTKDDKRLKPELTANIDILTAKLENVIAVPQRAVITRNGEKFVQILNDDGTAKEVKIKTGIRGSDGNTEILEGLEEGDKVIIMKSI